MHRRFLTIGRNRRQRPTGNICCIFKTVELDPLIRGAEIGSRPVDFVDEHLARCRRDEGVPEENKQSQRHGTSKARKRDARQGFSTRKKGRRRLLHGAEPQTAFHLQKEHAVMFPQGEISAWNC